MKKFPSHRFVGSPSAREHRLVFERLPEGKKNPEVASDPDIPSQLKALSESINDDTGNLAYAKECWLLASKTDVIHAKFHISNMGHALRKAEKKFIDIGLTEEKITAAIEAGNLAYAKECWTLANGTGKFDAKVHIERMYFALMNDGRRQLPLTDIDPGLTKEKVTAAIEAGNLAYAKECWTRATVTGKFDAKVHIQRMYLALMNDGRRQLPLTDIDPGLTEEIVGKVERSGN